MIEKDVNGNMKLRWATHILFLFLLVFPGAFAGESHKYKVVSVLDGDTFIATDGNIKFKVRIAAMDAPEKGQSYGKVAQYRLKKMLSGQNIAITSISKGVDRYGRVLGLVSLNGKDIALDLISEGLATYYRPSCKDYPSDKDKYNYDPRPYIAAEKEARKSKKNMWSDEHAMLPCKFRRL